MITGAMMVKALAGVGVMAITKTVIVPAAKVVGTQIGKGIGIIVNSLAKNGSIFNNKKKVEEQKNQEIAILDLFR